MRVFRLDLIPIAGSHIGREGLAGAVLGGGQRIIWIGRTGQEAISFLPLVGDLLFVDEGNGDRFVRTCLHTRRRFPDSESVRAHVALSNDASFLGILRHVVWAFPSAILATDALVIEVANDAGYRVFVVRVDRTTVHTSRIHAVMTGGGDRLLHRFQDCSTKKHTDIAPGLVIVEAVEIVAGGHARLATGASIQIDSKRILLAWSRRSEWNQITVILLLSRHRVEFVLTGEGGDRRQKLLLA